MDINIKWDSYKERFVATFPSAPYLTVYGCTLEDLMENIQCTEEWLSR